jgi:hypothetical protein
VASTATNLTLEEMPTHVFSELPAGIEQSCETCQNDCAAYRYVKEQRGVTAGHNKLICRVCASLILLVGKPCGLVLR